MPTISDLPEQDCQRPAPHAPHAWRQTKGGRGQPRRTYRCPGHTGAVAQHTIRLRADAFTPDRLATYGWPSISAAADAVGVHSSTLRRAVAGQIAPGERLMAQLIVGTGHSFDALFYVAPNTADGAS